MGRSLETRGTLRQTHTAVQSHAINSPLQIQQGEVQGPQLRAKALQEPLREQFDPAQERGEEEKTTQRDISTEYSIDSVKSFEM